MKTVGLLRKAHYRGLAWFGWMFAFTAAVYNMRRVRALAAVA